MITITCTNGFVNKYHGNITLTFYSDYVHIHAIAYKGYLGDENLLDHDPDKYLWDSNTNDTYLAKHIESIRGEDDKERPTNEDR